MGFGKRRGENRRAERAGKRGYEFWSRRPYFGEGKWGKMMTHRAERRAARRAITPGEKTIIGDFICVREDEV